MLNMNAKQWALPALLALAVFSIAVVHESKSQVGDGDGAAVKLNALLKQRRETLRQLVKVAEDQYRVGLSTFDSAIRASDQLLDVELELAEGHDARLAIHKQRVELLEKTAESRFRAGHATQADVLGAQAARLGAEIELVREQNIKP